MKIGLLFGSFNPVHTGHLIVASYMSSYTDLDQVWMVLSPKNPFKSIADLASDRDRERMLQMAVGREKKIKYKDIELHLSKPSYTINTLRKLQEKHSDYQFVVIIGSDIYPTYNQWRKADEISKNFETYVYLRPGYPIRSPNKGRNIQIFKEVPQLLISGTFIRHHIQSGESARYFVPYEVWKYIKKTNLYLGNKRHE